MSNPKNLCYLIALVQKLRQIPLMTQIITAITVSKSHGKAPPAT